MNDDIFAAPTSSLLDEEKYSAVQALHDQQSGLSAALGLCLWTAPIILIWVLSREFSFSNTGPMVLISGLLVGLLVNFHGRGITHTFRWLTGIGYTELVLIMHLDMTDRAFGLKSFDNLVVLICFIFGIVLALSLCMRRLNYEQRELLSANKTLASPKTRLRNSPWLVLPLTLMGVPLSTILSVFLLSYLFGWVT